MAIAIDCLTTVIEKEKKPYVKNKKSESQGNLLYFNIKRPKL